MTYKPGREDDDSGLQVFSLQQQRRQVGVLAEEQHLLSLDDRGGTSHDGTLKIMAEHSVSFSPPESLRHPNHKTPPHPASTMLLLTHATTGGGGGAKNGDKSADLLNSKKTENQSCKGGGAKGCAWWFMQKETPVNQPIRNVHLESADATTNQNKVEEEEERVGERENPSGLPLIWS